DSDLRYADPQPALFSFNSAFGACETCRGFGRVIGVDMGLVIPDTRKTLPGLRLASKYAVRIGGGSNQRIGLADGALLKENHLRACGGVRAAVDMLYCSATNVPLQVEVTSLDELQQAVDAGVRSILLDNFTRPMLVEAVQGVPDDVVLEASGGVNLDTVAAIAATGVHRISVGALTKDIVATDLSLQFWPWEGPS
ncbi:MAG: nicotinate-nucleotide diphosphorylase (carboxylating), partial [Betaproteobacteria bacterium]|nr:nicotinate-nucleotide diphosphorylase (carboxylating) [Betaproteobacteria bacterium]